MKKFKNAWDQTGLSKKNYFSALGTLPHTAYPLGIIQVKAGELKKLTGEPLPR